VRLEELSVRDFVEELGAGTPFPGGGAVAALSGSLAAALATMVARLTLGREKYQAVWDDIARADERAEALKHRFLALAQEDADAYGAVMAAYRLPKGSDAEKAVRREAVEHAMKTAARVPLETLEATVSLVEIAVEVLAKGNPNTLTDAGAALYLAHAAAAVAAANVRINLPAIRDEVFAKACKDQAASFMERVDGHFGEGVRCLEAMLP